MSLKHLKNLQVRIARLERSAVYYPSLEKSLNPRSTGYSVETGAEGLPVYNRHYESRISPILSMARGFKVGQRLSRQEKTRLRRSLQREGDSTCMVSQSFKAKNFSLKNETRYANRRSEELYYEEVADMLDDRDEIIVGRVGIFVFPFRDRGETGYLIY
tara:strand:+ start:20 stop:496 length:477 start_codon:yes stop_codon:yes gene_type:complete